MDDRQLIELITGAGYSIFPCTLSKKPMLTNGYKGASHDAATIQQWAKNPKKKLWGIPAEPNGFFAVDVDPEGIKTWEALCLQNGLPEPTPWQRTPRGGSHYLFKLPEGVKIPNNAGKLAPGIDLRSTGYICTGYGYQWQIPIDNPVSEAPPWLIDKIKASTAPRKEPGEVVRPAPDLDHYAIGEYWVNKALEAARPGNRNQTGFELALQLRDSGLTLSEAETYLSIYANGVTQTKDDPYTEGEAIASAREAYKGTPREPATLPRSLTKPPTQESEPAMTDQKQEPAKVKQAIPPEPEPPQDLDFEGIAARYVVRDYDFIMQDHPPTQYIIDGFIEEGSLNVWVGKFGSKKTWAALSAAACVSVGKPWLYRETKQGNVLIIDEESDDRRLSIRIKSALAGELITERAPIKFISQGQFNFLKQPQDQDLLIKEITEAGASLVFIDALVDVMAGGDENAVKDTQPVFMALRRVAKITNAAIVIIHHTNKMGDYRGSSAIPGALESMIQIESKPDSDLIVFKSLKVKDGQQVKFGALAIWVEGQFYLTTSGEIAEKAFLNKSQQYVLDYFTEQGDSSLQQLDEYAGGLYATVTLKAAIQKLINDKVLTRKNQGGKRIEAIYGIPSK